MGRCQSAAAPLSPHSSCQHLLPVHGVLNSCVFGRTNRTSPCCTSEDIFFLFSVAHPPTTADRLTRSVLHQIFFPPIFFFYCFQMLWCWFVLGEMFWQTLGIHVMSIRGHLLVSKTLLKPRRNKLFEALLSELATTNGTKRERKECAFSFRFKSKDRELEFELVNRSILNIKK